MIMIFGINKYMTVSTQDKSSNRKPAAQIYVHKLKNDREEMRMLSEGQLGDLKTRPL